MSRISDRIDDWWYDHTSWLPKIVTAPLYWLVAVSVGLIRFLYWLIVPPRARYAIREWRYARRHQRVKRR